MSDYSENPATDMEIDVGSLAAALWRKKGWIMLWAAVGLAAAGVFLVLVKPVYRSDARLLIERRETVFTRPNEEQSASAGTDFDALSVASQVEVLQSQSILKPVADKLKLGELPEFDPLLEKSGDANPLSTLLGLVGLSSKSGTDTREGRILGNLADKLSVYSVGGSRVVSVEATSENPILSAEIANAIVEEYILIQRNDDRDTAKDASQFLQGEIEELRAKVAQAEQEVEDFRVSADLIGADDESTLTKQQLSETLTLLSEISAQRSQAEAKADQIRRLIRSGAALDSSSDVQGSPLIQRLREQQVTLKTRIVDLQTALLPNHPQVQAARSQLTDLEAEIARQALLIARALEGDAEIATIRQKELEQEVARLKAATARANEQEIRLRALEREARAQRELLETYLMRFREATARENTEFLPVNARIISRANVPVKVHFPKNGPTLAIAGFAGTFLASLFILVSELTAGHGVQRRKTQTVSSPAKTEPDIPVSASDAAPSSDVAPISSLPRWATSGRHRPKEPTIDPVSSVRSPIPAHLAAMVQEDGAGRPQGAGDDKFQAVNMDASEIRGREDVLPDEELHLTCDDDAMPLEVTGGAQAAFGLEAGEDIPLSQLSQATIAASEAKRPGDTAESGGAGDSAMETDLYTIDDAIAAIERYQLGQIAVLPVFQDFGCADFALELARSLSDSGRSVVFIDTTNVDSGEQIPLAGISDVVAGDAELDEAVFADPLSSIDLVASGTLHLDPLDWAEGRTQEVLDALSSNYSIAVLHEGEGIEVPYLDELIERFDMLLFAVGMPLSRRQVASVLREKIGEVPAHSMFVCFDGEDGVESAA